MEAEVSERLLPRLAGMEEELVAEAMGIAAVPAPPYGEAERGSYLLRRFTELGLEGVAQDDTGNVVGVRPGAPGGTGPRLLLAAHMDTVFPAGTDCTPRREGGRIHGPGIRDNSAGVAVMLTAVRALHEAAIQAPGDIVVASTVGEEGLGNLRGMRALIEAWGDRVDAVLAVDGDLAGLIHQGIGSTRVRIRVHAAGGHSWGNFGAPSAVHAIARMIAAFTALPVPSEPRTTYNVGTVQGGISVNSIAADAEAVVDMRSVAEAPLGEIEARLGEVVAREAEAAKVKAEIEVLGRRPVGAIPADHPLVALVAEAHRGAGLPVQSHPSSTDANIPLAAGVPAVCTGASAGGGTHAPNEYLDVDSLVPGVRSLVLAIAAVMDRYPLRRRSG